AGAAFSAAGFSFAGNCRFDRRRVAVPVGPLKDRPGGGRNPSQDGPRNFPDRSMNLIAGARASDVKPVCQFATESDFEFIAGFVSDAAMEVEIAIVGMSQFDAGPHQKTHRAEMSHALIARR